MPDKEDYLKRSESQEWGRFLSSPAGRNGLLFMKLSCPHLPPSTDEALIKNAVGFEFWQLCLTRLEQLSELPPKPEKTDDEPLE